MKNKKRKVILLTGILLLIAGAGWFFGKNEKTDVIVSKERIVKEVRQEEKEKNKVPDYETVASEFVLRAEGEEILLNVENAKDESGNLVELSRYSENEGLLWNQKETEFIFDFTSEKGLYSIEFTYLPLKESDQDIVADIRIDGGNLYREMETIEFPRSWVPEGDNYFDEDGDEYASYLIQEEKVMVEPVRDRNGLYADSLFVELEEGVHTLGVHYVSGSMLLLGIKFVPAEVPDGYELYQEKQGTMYGGQAIKIQAEKAVSRSTREIPSYTHNDAAMEPYTPRVKRINAIGGGYWYKGNSTVSWEVDVPEDGYYKLAMRYIQNNEGLLSYRQILIDGKVPFQELSAYAFPYTDEFKTCAIGEDDPYLFYLTKGKHTLTMRAVTGEMKASVIQLEKQAHVNFLL